MISSITGINLTSALCTIAPEEGGGSPEGPLLVAPDSSSLGVPEGCRGLPELPAPRRPHVVGLEGDGGVGRREQDRGAPVE